MKLIKRKKRERYLIQTAGYSDKDELFFEPEIVSCGRIGDGVALSHDDGAGWVISYEDLVEMVERAKEYRGGGGDRR